MNDWLIFACWIFYFPLNSLPKRSRFPQNVFLFYFSTYRFSQNLHLQLKTHALNFLRRLKSEIFTIKTVFDFDFYKNDFNKSGSKIEVFYLHFLSFRFGSAKEKTLISWMLLVFAFFVESWHVYRKECQQDTEKLKEIGRQNTKKEVNTGSLLAVPKVAWRWLWNVRVPSKSP